MQQESLGPEDIPQLYGCLKSAISPDLNLRQHAEATIHSLEDRQGFCSCLAVRTHILRGNLLGYFALHWQKH